jgi:hypothetical protein
MFGQGETTPFIPTAAAATGLSSPERLHSRSDSRTLRHTPHASYDSSLELVQEIPPPSTNNASAGLEGMFSQPPQNAIHTPPTVDEETPTHTPEEELGPKGKRATLNTLQLATIIFYSVSGGPFGVEESVRAAGPFYTLIGFAIAPFIFSLPECLMTVELSAGGFKSSAAGAAWVEEAFGSRAGFMAGFLRCDF